MKYLFSVSGGSGSTFMIKNVRRCGSIVAARPDVIWRPNFMKHMGGLSKYKSNIQTLSSNGYEDFPESKTKEQFHERINKGKEIDFKLDLSSSIENNLIKYIKLLSKDEGRTAVFSNASKFQFFSKNNIKDVVFLIRHPLHSYISFTSKNRHPEFVESIGGQNSIKSIEAYSEMWNKYAEDIISSLDKKLNPIVIRFEFAEKDVVKSNNINIVEIFKKFNNNKRYYGALSGDVENKLRELTWNFYKEIFGNRWTI